MIDFYSTAVGLQRAIRKGHILEQCTTVAKKPVQKSLVILEACCTVLYSDDVKIAGLLTCQELTRMYRNIQAVTASEMEFFDEIESLTYITVLDTPVSREKSVCSITDPTLQIEFPQREDAIIYQLTLIKDIIKSLVSDRILPNSEAAFVRYIDKNYPRVIEMITAFVSSKGDANLDNLMVLSQRGYNATARVNNRLNPYVELIVPELTILQIPIQTKW